MGLLPEGESVLWDETKRIAEIVRQTGINKFIQTFKENKDRNDPVFKWGDELEYMLVKFDHSNRKVRLSLRAKEILKIMFKREEEEGDNRQVLWRPEAGSWQLESTPGHPYAQSESDQFGLRHILEVEPHMKSRLEDIKSLLAEDEALMAITGYPRFGCEDFTHPYTNPNPNDPDTIQKSVFVADELIQDIHPRCPLSIKNVRLRRGRKVAMNVSIFKDINTDDPFVERFNDEESDRAAKVDHIYMDSCLSGMGCCCVQTTQLGKNLNEAMHLYDQLAPFTPIAMALSAASPIWRGYLSDRDCRFSVLCDSLDCRTPEELGERPLKENMYRINKSRYDSINSYLSEANDSYNDIQFSFNEKYYQQLVREGVGTGLAKYVAYKFIRDPMAIYREHGQKDEEIDADHFENNFPSLRFKPPPPNSPIGWRVEFRTMELQSTEAENAAYVVLIVLLSRAILHFKLNLLIPMSKVDENMAEAQKRDSVNRCKFWFRNNIFTAETPPEVVSSVEKRPTDESYILMTCNEIMNGKGSEFPGLLPLIRRYIETIGTDADTERTIDGYLRLIGCRSSGRVKTTAQWIRDFVRQHPDYKHDSVVNDSINYDLMVKLNRIQNGFESYP